MSNFYQRHTVVMTQSPLQTLRNRKPPTQPPPPPQIYTRAIFIVPYNSPELVAKLQQAQQKVSCYKLGIQNPSRNALMTYRFSPQQIKDPYFDILTGAVIIDSDYRIYIMQGLAEGCLQDLIQEFPRFARNSNDFRYLANSTVKFKKRLYTEFGPDLKRIKLRDPLESIVLKPNLYTSLKDLMDTCHKILQLRKINRFKFVKMFSLCPNAKSLLMLERKFGDALTFQDIYGRPSNRPALNRKYLVGLRSRIQQKNTKYSFLLQRKSPQFIREQRRKRNLSQEIRRKARSELEMPKPRLFIK